MSDPGAPRVLLLVSNASYRADDFVAAARRLGAEVVLASDRCPVIAESSPRAARGAVVLERGGPDEAARSLLEQMGDRPFAAVVAADDATTPIAQRVSEALGLRGNPAEAVLAARDKRRLREALRAAGLPCPGFRSVSLDADREALARELTTGSPSFPVVLKPHSLSAKNDAKLHDRLRELKDQGRRHQGTGGDDSHPVLGYNFKLTSLQAAVGLAQLERLPARLAFARERDRWYREGLAGCPGIVLPEVDHAGGEVVQWTDALVERKDALRRALEAARVGHRAFWFPVHAHEPYAAPAAQFPVATRISAQGLWLPSAYSLTQADVARACDAIRAALKGH